MNFDNWISAALSRGFSFAAVLDTAELVLNPDFRKDCAANYCGCYGTTYACPPDCGSAEDMGQQLLRYPRALLLVSAWELPDWRDEARLRQARKWHNENAIELMGQLREPGPWLYAGASGCLLCNPCAKTQGLPCRYPERRYSCLSAYCVDVHRLSEHCGLDYFRKDGKLSFFSLCAF